MGFGRLRADFRDHFRACLNVYKFVYHLDLNFCLFGIVLKLQFPQYPLFDIVYFHTNYSLNTSTSSVPGILFSKGHLPCLLGGKFIQARSHVKTFLPVEEIGGGENSLISTKIEK